MSKLSIISIKPVDSEVEQLSVHRGIPPMGAHMNLMENEQHLAARFIGGLRYDIKES